MKNRLRKICATGMLALSISAFSTAALIAPKTAHAEGATLIDLPRIAEWIMTGLKDLGKSALLASVSTALINTATYAADRLAYDAAVFVAAGGNASDPLFENRSTSEYFSDYGASVAGEALSAIDETGILGNFSLCSPDASGVTLAFKFGIQSMFSRPEPGCEWSEVKDNWGGFLSQVASTAEDPFGKNSLITEKLSMAFNPGSNDFSVGIQLYSDVLNKAQNDAANETLKKLFSASFVDKENYLTGRVETPASMVEAQLKATSMASQEIRNKIQIQALANPDILLQIAKHAGSVFTNTVLSKVTENIYNGWFTELDQSSYDPFDANAVNAGSSETAQQAYRSFLTSTPISVQNFSILGDFSACPTSGMGLYNCVADSSLISALSRSEAGAPVTVEEAIEEGLLNGAWPLVKSTDTARDQDQFCYSYGYCHGNLVKLRKARIISTGWELAAESTANSDSSPITLGEVVAAFNDCSDAGELDDNHPWCHLIDPNWVLKYPDTQCRAQVYGEQLVASVTDQRQEVCVDMPSCIDEDSEGNCTGGYGYCVREENVWGFRGEECPEYYASCVSYEDPDGNAQNFLSNTTNSDNCTADSAGCLWYATKKVDDGTDTATMAFPDYADATVFATAEGEEDIYKNRIYFTAEVADCDAEDAGCRELVSRTDGTTLNMVSNPSFETDADVDGVPDGWVTSGTDVQYSTDSTVMLDGSSAVNPGSDSYSQSGIILTQGAEYTMSLYAAQVADSATVSRGAWIYVKDGKGDAIDFSGYSMSGDCEQVGDGLLFNAAAGSGPENSTYERFSCTFTVPVLEDTTEEITAEILFLLADLWFDDIQLEQESSASEYHEGYGSSTLDLSYVKVAPAYLGCTGDSAVDPADCANFAPSCVESDVGCSLYTPENGDPSVAGIADSLDECPEACVGYDTFKQEATRYEPDGDFPVYFIPDSAETCPAQAVGCDEFTDISTEEASYFTYIRACLTTTQAALNSSTSDDSAVFYTWEGSDTDGYQLKTWNLMQSNMGAIAYTYATSKGTDDAPNNAPCTTWVTSATGATCNDYTTVSSSLVLTTDSEYCDEHDDTITNPDCREFYDESGFIHYRSWSSTVTINDACVTYRKTDIVGSTAAIKQSNCEDSGGYYNTSNVECRYYGYSDESFTCSESESGCREYTGGRSRNSRQAFVEYFEDDSLTNWEAASAASVTLSNESIATDGHSLSSVGETVWTYVGGSATVCNETETGEGCASSASVLGGSCTVIDGEFYCGTLADELYAGKTYTLSFWAKGSGTLITGFDTTGSTSASPAIDASFFKDAVTLDTDWHEYSYGPLNMDSTAYSSFGDGASTLVFTPGSSTDYFFIDNVVLREGEDNIDVIKDSWVTPASCDQTAEGTSSPQYMLGCQEYTDQNSETAFLKSFSSLCEESQVGCSSYFMTQESDSTSAAVYGAYCSMIVDGEEATAATSCYFGLDSAGTGYDTASQFLCTIGVGTTNCEFDLDWYVPQEALTAKYPHLSYAASTVVSPADKDVFLVVNGEVECSSDVAGCTEVGLPVFSQDHTSVASWTSTYLMNIPEDYATTLCSEKELFCNAWTDSENTTSYFKTPQDQTCEYLSDVSFDGVTYSGWFKTGTDEPCYTTTDSDGNITPDYVIGGTESGIWRNGDDKYNNWVGTCTSSYDRCTEFQDLTDLATDDIYGSADGTSYFYLNNDSLMENSLPDSQKCNGQVSQKDGCGLFNDSSVPSKTSNMSASYIASKHADVLFGGSPNAMVDVIDCDSSSTITTTSGTTVDLCNNRCQYSAELYYDVSGPTSTYVYDGSCYDDSDCRPLTSETGESITGSCVTPEEDSRAPRLENDANTVLKVNRDRECSEWLSCSDAQTTWDERTNSYVTICGDVGLCTQYSGTADASFCSAWKWDVAAVVLDAEEYSGRDVSWYGDDYSGYSIPQMLPVDQLTQVNITDESVEEPADADYRLAYVAGSCEEGAEYASECSVGYCENTGSACVDSDACGVDGGDCIIGRYYDVHYAESRFGTDEVCASSTDCSIALDVCLSGVCATDKGVVTMETYAYKSTVAADYFFYPSVNYKEGTCVNEQCVLAPDGGALKVDDSTGSSTSEPQACKAFPEINSPFTNDIVDEWMSAYTRESEDEATGMIPSAFRSNFENAQTCFPGEDCECSYKKVTYGSSTQYFGPDGNFVSKTNSKIGVCEGGDNDGVLCSSDSGVYYSGEYAGVVYADTTCEDAGGVCVAQSRIDDVLGISGYCLERDTSTNILGDRNLNACLTWLPVDQLVGSTDLYAKETEAGYTEDTYYCDDPTLYENPRTSAVHAFDGSTTKLPEDSDPSNFTMGCISHNIPLEELNASGSPESDVVVGACLQGSNYCPVGYYALIGPPLGDWNEKGGISGSGEGIGTYAEACTPTPSDTYGCPFICVPTNAIGDDGESCAPPSSNNYIGYASGGNWVDVYSYDGEYIGETYSIVENYYIGDYTSFATGVDHRSDCVAAGREVYRFGYGTSLVDIDDTDGLDPGRNGDYWSSMAGEMVDNDDSYAGYEFPQDSYYNDSVGFYNLDFKEPTYYYGCGEAVKTASSETSGDLGSPWTDRLLNENASMTIRPNVSGADSSAFTPDVNKFEYVLHATADDINAIDTLPTPLGAMKSIEYFYESSDSRPTSFAQCEYRDVTTGSGRNDNVSSKFLIPDIDPANGGAICNVEDYSTDDLSTIVGSGGYSSSPESRLYYDINIYENDFTWSRYESGSSAPVFYGLDSSSKGAEPSAANVPNIFDGLIDQVFANRIDWLKYSDGLVDPAREDFTHFFLDAEDQNTGEYIAYGNSMETASAWDIRATAGTPPSVWAVDTKNCGDDGCEEDQEHGLTVNDQNEGDISANVFYRAYLKFYAAADKNQLPIRRVIVDWGDKVGNTDQTGSSSDNNFYMNHRGLETNSEVSICETSIESPNYEWGMNSDSCDPNYFSYNHIYLCSPSRMVDTCSDTDGDGLYDNTPCTKTGTECVYRPRVHVRDNWGWCGGTCEAGNALDEDDSGGCFTGEDYGIDEGGDTKSECAYEKFPTYNPELGVDPWVYYDGNITVTP